MQLRPLALALSFLVATAAVFAQEAEAPQPPANPWQVTCVSQENSADLSCTMSQNLIVGSTGQRVVAANIARRDGNLVMTLALPHGLRLPDGVTVDVDGSAGAQFPIVTADQNGAYAEVPLSEQLQSAMRSGALLNVTLQAFGGGPVVVQLSLNGFTAAIGRL